MVVVATAVIGQVNAAAHAAGTVQDSPIWCNSAEVLQVETLPRELPLSACPLDGRRIGDGPGGLGVGVPPGGRGVAAAAGTRMIDVWTDEYAVHVGEGVAEAMDRYATRLATAPPGVDRSRQASSLRRWVTGTIGIAPSALDATDVLLDDVEAVEAGASSSAGVPAQSLANVRAYVASVAALDHDERPPVATVRAGIGALVATAAAARDVPASDANRDLAMLLVLRAYATVATHGRDVRLPALDTVIASYRAAIGRSLSVRLPGLAADVRAAVQGLATTAAPTPPQPGEVSEEDVSASSPPPCADNARAYIYATSPPTHWQTGSIISWYYNYNNQYPHYSATGYSQALSRAFNDVTGLSDDCGYTWHPNIYNAFAGFTTTRTPNASMGTCADEGQTDEVSVIGWSPSMPPPNPGASATYAYTCVFRNINFSVIDETDMVISPVIHWDIPELDASIGYTCNGSSDLDVQAAITHEFGHSVGLWHVDEATHGRLTMSPVIDGRCERQERTLGWGDAIGLSSMYGQVQP